MMYAEISSAASIRYFAKAPANVTASHNPVHQDLPSTRTFPSPQPQRRADEHAFFSHANIDAAQFAEKMLSRCQVLQGRSQSHRPSLPSSLGLLQRRKKAQSALGNNKAQKDPGGRKRGRNQSGNLPQDCPLRLDSAIAELQWIRNRRAFGGSDFCGGAGGTSDSEGARGTSDFGGARERRDSGGAPGERRHAGGGGEGFDLRGVGKTIGIRRC
jgi:hypothetical protein